jgi:hypothetical protein
MVMRDRCRLPVANVLGETPVDRGSLGASDKPRVGGHRHESANVNEPTDSEIKLMRYLLKVVLSVRQ